MNLYKVIAAGNGGILDCERTFFYDSATPFEEFRQNIMNEGISVSDTEWIPAHAVLSISVVKPAAKTKSGKLQKWEGSQLR
jgi:hypothetical protein